MSEKNLASANLLIEFQEGVGGSQSPPVSTLIIDKFSSDSSGNAQHCTKTTTHILKLVYNSEQRVQWGENPRIYIAGGENIVYTSSDNYSGDVPRETPAVFFQGEIFNLENGTYTAADWTYDYVTYKDGYGWPSVPMSSFTPITWIVGGINDGLRYVKYIISGNTYEYSVGTFSTKRVFAFDDDGNPGVIAETKYVIYYAILVGGSVIHSGELVPDSSDSSECSDDVDDSFEIMTVSDEKGVRGYAWGSGTLHVQNIDGPHSHGSGVWSMDGVRGTLHTTTITRGSDGKWQYPSIMGALVASRLIGNSHLYIEYYLSLPNHTFSVRHLSCTKFNAGESFNSSFAVLRNGVMVSSFSISTTCPPEESVNIKKNITLTIVEFSSEVPVEGAFVSIAGVGSGTTNVSGEVTFLNVYPGTYSVTISKSGFVNSGDDDISNDEIVVS